MALPVLLRTHLWVFEWNWNFEPICSSAVCKRIIFYTPRFVSHYGHNFFQKPFAILSDIITCGIFIDKIGNWKWSAMQCNTYDHAACLSCVTTCQSVCRRRPKVCFCKVHTLFKCCLYTLIWKFSFIQGRSCFVKRLQCHLVKLEWPANSRLIHILPS